MRGNFHVHIIKSTYVPSNFSATCTVIGYLTVIFNVHLLCGYSAVHLSIHSFSWTENVLINGSCCLPFLHGFHTGSSVLLICDNGQVCSLLAKLLSVAHSTDNTEHIPTVYCVLAIDPCLNLTKQHYHHFFTSLIY